MTANVIEDFSILKKSALNEFRKHKLTNIIVLVISAVVSGAEGRETIEEFGHSMLMR